MLLPLARIIGFRPMFPIDEFISENSLDIVEVIPVNTFGYWDLDLCKKQIVRDLVAVGSVGGAEPSW